jgi:long-subunit fatty acid transport protein
MKRRRFAAAAVVALAPATASAQAVQNIVLRNSFNPIGAGARGLGMGGAFIAVADDGTAASFNPAGLAQLRRTELALVGFTSELRSTRPDLDSNRTVSETVRHDKPDFAGLSVPFAVSGRNLTVQLSYQRAVDLFGKGTASTRDTIAFRDLRINQAGFAELRGDIAPEQSGAFHTVSASAAYEVTRRFSLGAAVNYWIADWTASGRASFRISSLGPGGRPTLLRSDVREFRQAQSARALNLNAGFLLRYARFSLGGVLRLPFAASYELQESGRATSTEVGRAETATPVDVSLNSRLQWPQSAGVGAALRPFRGMTLSADYSRSQWSRASIEDVVDGALLTPQEPAVGGVEPAPSFIDRNFFDLLPASQTATADTSQWRAGGEYLVSLPKVVVPLRGGIFRDRSPVRDLGKDEARRIEGWTAGTGLNFTRVVLDVAYEQRRSEGVVGVRLRPGPATAPSVSTETVKEKRIVASLIYRFAAEDDPLKRALRFLFVGPKEKEDN